MVDDVVDTNSVFVAEAGEAHRLFITAGRMSSRSPEHQCRGRRHHHLSPRTTPPIRQLDHSKRMLKLKPPWSPLSGLVAKSSLFDYSPTSQPVKSRQHRQSFYFCNNNINNNSHLSKAIFLLIFGIIFNCVFLSTLSSASTTNFDNKHSNDPLLTSATRSSAGGSPHHATMSPSSLSTMEIPLSTSDLEEFEKLQSTIYDDAEAELLALDETADSESRLHRMLMDNYSKDARPARVSNVSMHLQLISLDDVQESGHLILTVQIWMTWRDLRFRWSPSNYSGVVSLQILPVDRIWFPLFWIRNSAQPDIQNSFWSHFPAFIGWSGIVSWVSSGKITVACDLDFFYYPSDSQTCSIQFAAHDSYHVNLTSRDEERPICFDRYTNNSLWEITGVRAMPTGTTVHRTTEFLNFDVRLRRRPLTDILRIFLPTVCLAIVSLIAFLLPPDSGDKLNVTFTTMLAFFVMFLAITDMVPFTAEHTPIMTYFVVSTLLLSTVETILCAVIMTIADAEKARRVEAAAEAALRKQAALATANPLRRNSSSVATLTAVLERRGSMGYTWSENIEQVGTGHPDNDLAVVSTASSPDMRPRSFSSSTTTSNTTDSGIIDLSGADAATLAAIKTKRRKSSTSLMVDVKGIDGASLIPKSLRRRVAVFFIRAWRRVVSVARNTNYDSDDTWDSTNSDDELPHGIISSKRLNMLSFFVFGAIKMSLISLVSVILYDQSRQEDVESAGFHRPEYSNCWR